MSLGTEGQTGITSVENREFSGQQSNSEGGVLGALASVVGVSSSMVSEEPAQLVRKCLCNNGHGNGSSPSPAETTLPWVILLHSLKQLSELHSPVPLFGCWWLDPDTC